MTRGGCGAGCSFHALSEHGIIPELSVVEFPLHDPLFPDGKEGGLHLVAWAKRTWSPRLGPFNGLW